MDRLAANGGLIEAVRLCAEPNASFPNGIPNPQRPENQQVTGKTVPKSGAACGIAWDGSFDQCFFVDHTAEFISGEYLVGLLAASMLDCFPGETVVHDPRVSWNTKSIITNAGGRAAVSKTGRALIKAKMPET